jgi:tetratricopeptide (TPR) repeat protein
VTDCKSLHPIEPPLPRAAENRRRHAHNYCLLGQRRADAGAHEEAQQLLAQSLRFDPRYRPALRALGTVELALGHLAEAGRLLERAIVLDPTDGLSHLALGDLALAQDDPTAALAHYDRAEDAGFEGPEMRHSRGIAQLMLGDGLTARMLFLQLTNEHPDNPRAWDGLGSAQRLCGDHAMAVESFTHALKLHPGFNEARDHLAQTLLDQGQAAKARKVLLAALDLEPDRLSSRHLLAVACANDNDFAEAIDRWEALIAEGGSYPESYHMLANAYLHQGRNDDALRILRTLVTLHPDHIPGVLQLGLLLFERGDADGGWMCLEAARAIAPDHPLVLQAFSLARSHPRNRRRPPGGDNASQGALF